MPLGRRTHQVMNQAAGGSRLFENAADDKAFERAVAEYADNGGTLTLRRSYVHGLQYIDERAVMRDHEGDGQDYYYLLQELYSVSGLATSNGLRAEHAVYDAYGQATLYAWPSADVNGDGTVNIFDQVAVRDALNTISPLRDVNLDGAVNIFDLVTVRGQLDTSAVATTTSNVGNPYYFTGRLTDTLHASDLLTANDPHFRRLQDNRNRTYDPKHGRWLQRDQLGISPSSPFPGMPIDPTNQYADGVLLYAYVASDPITRQDPYGLLSADDIFGAAMTFCLNSTEQRSFYVGLPVGPLGEVGVQISVQRHPNSCCCCDVALSGQGSIDVTGKVRRALDVIHNQTARRFIKRYMPTVEASLTLGGTGTICRSRRGGYSGSFCTIQGSLTGDFGFKKPDGRTNKGVWVCIGPVCVRLSGSIGGSLTQDICGQKGGSSASVTFSAAVGVRISDYLVFEGSIDPQLAPLGTWDGFAWLSPGNLDCN